MKNPVWNSGMLLAVLLFSITGTADRIPKPLPLSHEFSKAALRALLPMLRVHDRYNAAPLAAQDAISHMDDARALVSTKGDSEAFDTMADITEMNMNTYLQCGAALQEMFEHPEQGFIRPQQICRVPSIEEKVCPSCKQ